MRWIIKMLLILFQSYKMREDIEKISLGIGIYHRIISDISQRNEKRQNRLI